MSHAFYRGSTDPLSALFEVDDLVKKYDSIAPFLIKIEETTAGTKTGAAATMADYYLYWERRIFNAITTMLIRAMASFQTLFKPPHPGEKRPPLVKIKADFNPPEVAEAPWSVAEWAVALRFDNPRATV